MEARRAVFCFDLGRDARCIKDQRMDTTLIVIEIILFALTCIGFIASAVWGIATIKGAVLTLQATIKSLTKSVDGLSTRIDELEHHHANTRERLAAVEAKQESA